MEGLRVKGPPFSSVRAQRAIHAITENALVPASATPRPRLGLLTGAVPTPTHSSRVTQPYVMTTEKYNSNVDVDDVECVRMKSPCTQPLRKNKLGPRCELTEWPTARVTHEQRTRSE